MKIRELGVSGSFEITPTQFGDDRGLFAEWYRFDVLEQAVGTALDLRQANLSVSKRGVLRGIHFADVPPGQAKYVTAVRGAVIDYVVDLRVGSPTFGQWDSVLLDDVDRRAVYLSEGLGHAFLSLADDTVVTYLVSDVYRPDREHGVNALDPEIGLELPIDLDEISLSPKDEEAPSLAEAIRTGILPTWVGTDDDASRATERQDGR
ncbi:dTDP-4-dehydrorhamnose 3,5-epimerase family protein [Agromyces aureus]|uniref:dTDP-4-dehydrorhamnose 3,5-epimerase n=1 Tax=Agromyces aureus TaxID=453304 RepID=A0A191WL67_9MICO|nr:dTDP-4-dehydrorhamnose 3,5-epimerase [Agromyces aureus]ANJ28954.1 dTDP-4-dehydrorhamnose 3,5-epimerase [Agromyces aureus]